MYYDSRWRNYLFKEHGVNSLCCSLAFERHRQTFNWDNVKISGVYTPWPNHNHPVDGWRCDLYLTFLRPPTAKNTENIISQAIASIIDYTVKPRSLTLDGFSWNDLNLCVKTRTCAGKSWRFEAGLSGRRKACSSSSSSSGLMAALLASLAGYSKQGFL